MARIMAIDYGSKRVGIAVTDALQLIATSLTTVLSHEAMLYIRSYVQKEEVELFVVGLPLKESESYPLIENFAKGLKKNFPAIPVVFEDEQFTSQRAFQTMIDSGIGKKKRRDKKLVDKISAVLILKSYLEYRTTKK